MNNPNKMSGAKNEKGATGWEEVAAEANQWGSGDELSKETQQIEKVWDEQRAKEKEARDQAAKLARPANEVRFHADHGVAHGDLEMHDDSKKQAWEAAKRLADNAVENIDVRDKERVGEAAKFQVRSAREKFKKYSGRLDDLNSLKGVKKIGKLLDIMITKRDLKEASTLLERYGPKARSGDYASVSADKIAEKQARDYEMIKWVAGPKGFGGNKRMQAAFKKEGLTMPKRWDDENVTPYEMQRMREIAEEMFRQNDKK